MRGKRDRSILLLLFLIGATNLIEVGFMAFYTGAHLYTALAILNLIRILAVFVAHHTLEWGGNL